MCFIPILPARTGVSFLRSPLALCKGTLQVASETKSIVYTCLSSLIDSRCLRGGGTVSYLAPYDTNIKSPLKMSVELQQIKLQINSKKKSSPLGRVKGSRMWKLSQAFKKRCN